MESVFYLKYGFYAVAAIAVIATLLVIVQSNPVHALLYLIVSLLAIAVVFYLLGAPFAAALEVIIYAGAILVLFVFVIMMLNVGADAVAAERHLLRAGAWVGPLVLTAALLAELVYVLVVTEGRLPGSAAIESKTVGVALFGPYLLGVEIASMLLLSGLVGACHLGRHWNARGRKTEEV
jgi:NADH-quinone oxidoreductase subunit J